MNSLDPGLDRSNTGIDDAEELQEYRDASRIPLNSHGFSFDSTRHDSRRKSIESQGYAESRYASSDQEFDVRPISKPDRQLPLVFAFIYSFLPMRSQRVLKTVGSWIQGPQPARSFTISPIFPNTQRRLLQFAKHIERTLGRGWLWYWSVLYLFVFLASLNQSFTLPGFGIPLRLACISKFWYVACPCWPYKKLN